MADLGNDIWQMSQKATYDFGQRSQVWLSLKHVYRVVDAGMTVKCVGNKCRNISDAVDVVKRYESLYEDRRGSKGSVVRDIEAEKPVSTEDTLNKLLILMEKLVSR